MTGKIKLMYKAWQTLKEGRTLLFCCRKLTSKEMISISEYINGDKYMSKYPTKKTPQIDIIKKVSAETGGER